VPGRRPFLRCSHRERVSGSLDESISRHFLSKGYHFGQKSSHFRDKKRRFALKDAHERDIADLFGWKARHFVAIARLEGQNVAQNRKILRHIG
jgi:hypothetical protein